MAFMVRIGRLISQLLISKCISIQTSANKNTAAHLYGKHVVMSSTTSISQQCVPPLLIPCACNQAILLAQIIDGETLCVHGGLSPDIRTLDQIRVLSRAQEIPHEGAFCGASCPNFEGCLPLFPASSVSLHILIVISKYLLTFWCRRRSNVVRSR
jgi:hypothetical protein